MKYFRTLLFLIVLVAFCRADIRSELLWEKIAESALNGESSSSSFDDSNATCICNGTQCWCCGEIDILDVIHANICLEIIAGIEPHSIEIDAWLDGTREFYFKIDDNTKECLAYGPIDFCVAMNHFEVYTHAMCGCLGVEIGAFNVYFGPWDFGCFGIGSGVCPTPDFSSSSSKSFDDDLDW